MSLLRDKRSNAATIILLSLSSLTLGQSLPLTRGRDYVEEQIRLKLDRILNPEEYVLDIKVTPSTPSGSSLSSDGLLPGLQVLGPKTQLIGEAYPTVDLGGSAELLIIFDKKVSKERTAVARDLAARIIDNEGLKNQVKLTTSQKDISKIPTPPVIPPEPAKEPPLLEQLIQQKDLLTKAMIALWGALVSLIAVYFIVRRLALGGASAAESRTGEAFHGDGKPQASHDANSNKSDQARSGARTRDELYSKDERFLQSIKETTDEAKLNPNKIARILSRWVSANDDTVREAALFLRNCEIKTMEAISSAMHPSELEKIIDTKIEDFEPFGTENQRSVERMRSDLAVLASEAILKDRPDPLQFLKRLSDTDLSSVLQGESLTHVALIATQVPAHRLLKFYETLTPSDIEQVLHHFARLSNVSVSELEALVPYFENKVEVISGNLLTDKDRESAVHQMISSVPSPQAQCELTKKLAKENPQLYQRIRPSLLLATDFRFIPMRMKSMITQTIDASTLGTSLSDFEESFEELLDGTPLPYQSVFRDSKNKKYETYIVSRSWKSVTASFQQLLSSGLISKTEVMAIIQKAGALDIMTPEVEAIVDDESSDLPNTRSAS